MCICKGLTSSILSNLPGIYIYGLAELGLLCVARIDQASKNKTTNQASISSMIYIIRLNPPSSHKTGAPSVKTYFTAYAQRFSLNQKKNPFLSVMQNESSWTAVINLNTLPLWGVTMMPALPQAGRPAGSSFKKHRIRTSSFARVSALA